MGRLKAPRLALVLTTCSVLGYVSFWLMRSAPEPNREVAARRVALAAADPTPPPAPRSGPAESEPHAAARHMKGSAAEERLTAELRALRLRDPRRALASARDANRAHPSSPAAPERAWIAVRALEDLRRFHEARELALDMRERYPQSPWTNDVERHVLVHPLDQPSREAKQAALGIAAAP